MTHAIDPFAAARHKSRRVFFIDLNPSLLSCRIDRFNSIPPSLSNQLKTGGLIDPRSSATQDVITRHTPAAPQHGFWTPGGPAGLSATLRDKLHVGICRGPGRGDGCLHLHAAAGGGGQGCGAGAGRRNMPAAATAAGQRRWWKSTKAAINERKQWEVL